MQERVVSSPPLSGRQGELARLQEALAGALTSGTFRLVVLRGVAGAGRTALIDAFLKSLASDVRGLSVRAGPESRRPWALAGNIALEALDLLRPSAPLPLVRSFETRLAPMLGREVVSGDASEAEAALGELLSRLAREHALVIALDDVDDSDGQSLKALNALVATLCTPAALRADAEAMRGGLVLLSVRDEGMPERLEELIARTPSIGVHLGALDIEGVRSWVTRGEALERLLDVSGGVPGRLEALLSEAPIDLASRRIEKLGAEDRELLLALAIAARPVDVAFVNAFCGRRDASARLGRLVESALVQSRPGTGRTLYSLARSSDASRLLSPESAPAARLSRAAAFLSGRGDYERAFVLFSMAGEHERALEAALSAVAALESLLAFESAESLLSRALSVKVEGAELRREAWERLSLLRERIGDVRGALAALGRSRALSGESSQRAMRARAARLCLKLGAPKPARRLAKKVLEGGDADAVALEARVALADSTFLSGAWEEALFICDRLNEAPAPERCVSENVRGKALLCLGRLDEARSVFLENAQRAASAGLHLERARALFNVGVVAHRAQRLEEARAAYQEVLSGEGSSFTPIAHANLSSLHLTEGEAESALSHAHRALAEFARRGQRKEQAHASQNLARIMLYLGDFERAEEIASHARLLASQVGDPYVEAGGALVSAEVKLARREPEAGRALVECAAVFHSLGNPRYRAEALVLGAEAHLLSGELETAKTLLDEAREGGALGQPGLAAPWALAEAELHLARKELDLAASSLSRAKAALVASPSLEGPARLQTLTAVLAQARGEEQRALHAGREAALVYEELASRVNPARRVRFLSHPLRRQALEKVGREQATPTPSRLPPVRQSPPVAALVGHSPAIARINTLISRLGPTQATVLVRGESGTGKELVAKALHAASQRRSMPFVAVNCGALGEELLLSELFGHEKGAFTGAMKERKGRFELADGGTIFLDEVGDISPRAQVALLRVLQEREFERVGGTRTLKVDVRVICATNRNLEELMARGGFREDLYYRLRGATLTLPPLRERLEDLGVLAAHCLERLSERSEGVRHHLSAASLHLLARHDWPGNVRELNNVLETAAMLSTESELSPASFELFPELFRERAPGATAPPAASVDFYALLKGRDVSLRELRQELEVDCIAAALGEAGGNISEAARLLKLKRSRLSQVVNAEPRLKALAGHGDESEEGEDE